MLEKGFRRAELLLRGLTQQWDTREDGAGTGCCSGLQARTGEFSSPTETRWVPLVTSGREGGASPRGGKESVQKHPRKSNAGAANAAGGVAPAEDFHARLISAAKGRRRRRRLSCESNFTGQKRQQQREPISRLTKGEGAGSGDAGLSKNRLRWGMEAEDASGQQTPADFLLTEGGEGAAPRSTPCQRYGSRLLSLKD